ncbi:MAG: hypothetical protein H0T62_06080 [Parachlamydiaceae bacterium]|nr:hypothetical protein [Parachlamydiaceae bacterium]
MTKMGDSVGAPQQLSSFEMQSTASAEVAKAGMKVAIDTLEAGISFIVLDRDNKSGSPPANPNRPVLAPLINVRMAGSSASQTDESWHSALNDLLNLMPKDFRELFTAMLLLPKDQQNPDFLLLSNSLQTFAMLMTLFDTSGRQIDPESLAGIRAEANLLLPYLALASSAQDGKVLVDQLQSFLEVVGPNNSNFDALAGYGASFSSLMEEINTAIGMLQNPSTEKAARIILSNTADKLNGLADNFDRLYGGNELLLFGSILQSTALTAEALSLSQPGSASLLFALSLATTGILSSESSLGLVGDGFSKIIDSFSDAMILAAGEKNPAGTSALISQFATALLTTLFLTASLAHDHAEVSKQTSTDPTPEIVSERNFGYSLLATLLTNSKILSNVSKTLMQAADVKENVLSDTTALFATMLCLSLIFASASGSGLTTTGALIKSQESSLLEGIKVASNLITNRLETGEIADEKTANLNVYLKQASIALEQGNGEGFFDALSSMIETTGTTNSELVGNLKGLKALAVNFQNGLSVSADELNSNTGIHVAA